MTEMSAADRMAYIGRRDAAIAAALTQVHAAAPAAVADAGRHAQEAADLRHVTIRASGPQGIRKAALEMVIQEGLAARVELDALLTEETAAAERQRLADEETVRARPAGIQGRLATLLRKAISRPKGNAR